MGVSRKREREIVEQYVATAAFATLLMVGGVMGDALVSEMCLHRAKIDAVVRMECERMRDGLE
uniref:Uncharacterized protein n=1 Tax=Oryza glumipatula TaxID=40148 RepID=A0A0E0B406_9ORYZ